MKTLLAIDFCKDACATYSANFPDVEVRCDKVEAHRRNLPQSDVIIAGPPCQGFSLAGKGLGEFDPRNGWPATVAAVEFSMPRMFLFENVSGMLTVKHIKYLRKVFTALERLGYVVEMKRMDSVNYGVPQFRDRIWLWGIRQDVHATGVRHRWPAPTHAWPWPEPGMFGDHGLQRAVTVGQALGISHWQSDGVWFEGSGIAGTVMGGGRNGPVGGEPERQADGKYTRHERDITPEPSTTIAGHMGGALGGGTHPRLVVMGAGRHDITPKTTRDITGEPSQTIVGQWQGHQQPIVLYRWSDAMLQKHPPASPASPASTVQAKYLKGGAEGLVEITDDPRHQPHQPANSLTGGSAKAHSPNASSGYVLAIDTKQQRTTAPVTALGSDSRHALVEAEPSETLCGSIHEPMQNWKAKKWVRRLTVMECARLQSMPDNFKWPAKITKTAMYRIIGNGQASLMVWHLAQALAAADPEIRTAISLFCGGGVGDVGFHGRYWSFSPS